MKLKWQKHSAGHVLAHMGAGRTAYITLQPWRGPRKWVLSMPGADGTRGFFEARFHRMSDAKTVACLMVDEPE